MRLLGENCNADNLSPLTLAFVGDGVYELFVREHLACLANRPAGELNSRKVQMVKAASQAEAFRKISDFLSEKELSIFKRGRNAHPPHSAKNASSADYHAATGLEALFGWLYLSDMKDRAAELFRIIAKD